MFELLIVLSVIFLIAMVRVRLVLEYDGDGFRGFVGIYPIKIRFPKSKKKKKTKTKNVKAKKEERDTNQKEKSYGSLKELTWMIKPSLKTLGKLIRMIIIKQIKADIRLAGKDAASTAMLYGKACAGVSTVLPVLDSRVKIKKKQIFISPDFNSSETTICLYANMYLRVWKLVVIGVFLLYQLINKKRIMDEKKGIEKNG